MSQDGAKSESPAIKRLPSLKPPRDVTLSQSGSLGSNSSTSIIGTPTLTGANRAKFAPNLALAGKRQVAPVVEENSSTSKKHGQKKGLNEKERRKPHNKHGPVLVQSKGVFGEGFAEAPRKPGGFDGPSSSFGGGGGGGAGGGSGFSSSFNSRSSSKSSLMDIDDKSKSSTTKFEPTETDEAALAQLIRDSAFISDLKQVSIDSRPRVVPADCKVKREEYFGTDDGHHSDRRKHKKEDIETIDDQNDSGDSQSSTAFSNEEDSSGRFIFVQLPPVLANMFNGNEGDGVLLKKTIKAEPLGSPTTNGPSETTPSSETTVEKSKGTEKRHILSGASHGWCGKLQILKSGKMRLKFGDNDSQPPVYFDVNSAKTHFAQQLVHIKCEDESGSMNIIADKIKHRIIVTPDVESIAGSLKR